MRSVGGPAPTDPYAVETGSAPKTHRRFAIRARHCTGSACKHRVVDFDDVSRLAAQLDGVAERRRGGRLEWRYHGRLVTRQIDASHIVIRASFELRDLLLRSFPETFSLPDRFAKHMMVVADLANGNADAIEDAVIEAWQLQSRD